MWWAVVWYHPHTSGPDKTEGALALETEAKDAMVHALSMAGYRIVAQHVSRLSDAEALVNRAKFGLLEKEWQ